LVFGRVVRVVTDLAILGFDEDSKAMRLEQVHPGVSVEDVIENTGFDLIIPDVVPTTEPPTEEELNLLRALDPDSQYL
jgi:glutaconate CoA-transferase subunit B